MIEVVAAIIEREDRILICRRRPGQSHALKWEFPGGKLEAGETPAQALERELAEELDIRVIAAEEIMRYQYTYPGKDAILLIFLRVREFVGEPRNLIFHEMRWEPSANLPTFDFLEGDRDFIHFYTGHMATAVRMADPAQNEFLANLEAKGRRANHFFRMMANRPKVLEAFVPFYGAIMGPGPVDRRIKELVYLT